MSRELDEIIRTEGTTIWFFFGKEIIADPISKEKRKIYYNPLPKKVLLRQIVEESLTWRFPGQKVSGAEQFLLEEKYLDDLKLTLKIEILGNEYYGYKDDTNKLSYHRVGGGSFGIYYIVTVQRKI